MEKIVLIQANAATMVPSLGAYGLIKDCAVAVNNGKIAWCGARADMPETYAAWPQKKLDGRLVTPALIDCHTHIIHAGNRANEFEMRLSGASYEEVSRAGGGIVSTVQATRAATEDELIRSATPRLKALISEGVCTVEIKSGYGLDIETELKILRAARRIETEFPVRVKTSFLGAHAVPVNYKDNPDAYIDEVCLPALVAAHEENLVDAVDGFCESIGFTTTQIERVFNQAKALGLPVKLHAEQLSNSGGTALAAKYKALSSDHLEYLDEVGIKAMATSDTVAVLLPGAYYFLRDTQPPPIDELRALSVPMAVATDCNPGSSPLTSLLLAMNMACTLFKLTPEEALAGVTHHAAQALGLRDSGMIAEGLRADLAVWDVGHPCELSYHMGFTPLHARIFGGRL